LLTRFENNLRNWSYPFACMEYTRKLQGKLLRNWPISPVAIRRPNGRALQLPSTQHKADRIVAEVNNGGDMVEATIRMVDPNVSYNKVHAWAIDRLIPYAKNARTHSDAQIAAIAASIKRLLTGRGSRSFPSFAGGSGGIPEVQRA
jgi:hypothetical protein